MRDEISPLSVALHSPHSSATFFYGLVAALLAAVIV